MLLLMLVMSRRNADTILFMIFIFSEISNQILELYEQSNVAPPSSQGNDTDRSPASVANHRASGKAPGSTGAPAAHEHHQASRQSSQQNMPGHRGYDHPDPEKQNSNQRTPQNDARDGVVNSNDGPKMSSSMMDAMKKIDKDKVKAALEKRRKSKGDVSRKVDVMDDDDLIERELEHGVELAAEGEKVKQERRQSWSHPSAHREDQQKAARVTGATEEGELSTDSQEHHSPTLDNRRRNDIREHRNYDRGERDIKRLRP
jgi:cyclin T